MKNRTVLGMVAWMCVGALGTAQIGCEMLVQLDRSAVDAGPDVGCPICSDASERDAAEAEAGAEAGDAAGDRASSDAPAEASTPEAGGDGGGYSGSP